MSILKDINKLAQAVGEARRASKFLVELTDLKKQITSIKQERDRELRRRQELEAAIKTHKKAMEDCPRHWESDQVLWKLVE
jgi:predicted  nucleic acid-binding Zn-ribbon protein